MNKNVFKRVMQVLFMLILQGVLLFISSCTLRWQWAWIFVSVGIFILIINFFVLPVELIEERGKKKENVKKWDRILTTTSIIPIMGIYIISGLDFRFGWSNNINVFFNIAGLLFYFLGSMLFTWAMISNKYFSTMVRIQNDRDHSVVTTGPYKYVRHPGYVGYIVFTLATPVSLGSIYGLLISGIASILFIIRTFLEDKTLRNELNGYLEYCNKVKYKLIPLIW
jgi:protein-S-isoprenylcysteine O-methyltransferase Ste14